MKKNNNKSWVRQLSESYIRQALNENEDIHAIIDDRHNDLTRDTTSGKVKKILDDHAQKFGPFRGIEHAAEFIVNKHNYLMPDIDRFDSDDWYDALVGDKYNDRGRSNDSPNDTYSG